MLSRSGCVRISLVMSAFFLFVMLLSFRVSSPSLPPNPAFMACPSPAPCPSTSAVGQCPNSGCFASGRGSDCRVVFPSVPAIDIGGMSEADEIDLPPPSFDVPITFFTAPRGFDSDTSERQRAAILSWQLQPSSSKEIVLFGNDSGIKEFASEWGLRHQPKLHLGDDNIPLMDAMFQVVKAFFLLSLY
jgi:hypothetical protein